MHSEDGFSFLALKILKIALIW